jgi:hypothetical protein
MNKVALLIRDYENKNLKSKKLHDFIKMLNIILKNQNIILELYIHTWKYNNVENWRKFSRKEITEEYINKYFIDFNVKKILIEDNTNNIANNNFASWSSQYKLIKQVDLDYLFIINTSFDLNENLNDIIIQVLNLTKQETVKKIYFTKSKCYEGLNNCYYGDYNSMYNLINNFYNNYNIILDKYEETSYELILWKETKKMERYEIFSTVK